MVKRLLMFLIAFIIILTSMPTIAINAANELVEVVLNNEQFAEQNKEVESNNCW